MKQKISAEADIISMDGEFIENSDRVKINLVIDSMNKRNVFIGTIHKVTVIKTI